MSGIIRKLFACVDLLARSIQWRKKMTVLAPEKPKRRFNQPLNVKGVMASVAITNHFLVDENTPKPKETEKKKSWLDTVKSKKLSDPSWYEEYIQKTDDVLQEAMDGIGREVYQDLKVHIKQSLSESPKFRELLKNGSFGEDDAQLHIQQIETFAEIIRWVWEEPWQSIVLIGATQLGKTMIMISMFVLELALSMKVNDGTYYKAIYLCPDSIQLDTSAAADAKCFMDFYDFELTSENGTQLFSEWRATQSLNLTNEEKTTIPIFRRSKGIKEQLKKIIKDNEEMGRKLIFIIDECHWGSNDTGILAEIIKTLNDFNAKELAKRKSPSHFMVAISATPFNFNVKTLRAIFCRTYEGYVGYAFWMGQLLDPRWTPIYPKLYAFDNKDVMTDKFHTPLFHFVKKDCYRNYNAYERELEKKDKKRELKDFGKSFLGTTHEQYRLFCEDKIIELIENCLLHYNELNAKGFLWRFFHTNDEVSDFIRRRQKDFDPRIKCMAWVDEVAKQNLGKSLREQGIQYDDYKVIFVTGSARMGCRVDDKDRIYYGAEFSSDSHLATMLQGILGRLTGAKSEAPIVFFPGARVEEIERYVASRGKDFTRKPSPRTNLIGNGGRGKTITFELHPSQNGLSFSEIGRNDLESFLKKWAKKSLNPMLEGRKTKPEGLTGLRLSQDKKDEFWNVFNHATFMELESVLDIDGKQPFFRLENDETPHEFCVDEDDNHYNGTIGFRYDENQAKRNSNKSTRNRKNNILYPQLIVDFERKGKAWEAVPLRIKFSLRQNTFWGTSIPKPNELDIAHQLFGEHLIETEEI